LKREKKERKSTHSKGRKSWDKENKTKQSSGIFFEGERSSFAEINKFCAFSLHMRVVPNTLYRRPLFFYRVLLCVEMPLNLTQDSPFP
jgi:hypothetical protein